MSLAIDLPEVREFYDESDTHQRCQIIISFTWRHKTWSKTWERRCRRRAKVVVEISCVVHGSERQGICRPHLALLRRSGRHLKCADCDLPAIWRMA